MSPLAFQVRQTLADQFDVLCLAFGVDQIRPPARSIARVVSPHPAHKASAFDKFAAPECRSAGAAADLNAAMVRCKFRDGLTLDQARPEIRGLAPCCWGSGRRGREQAVFHVTRPKHQNDQRLS